MKFAVQVVSSIWKWLLHIPQDSIDQTCNYRLRPITDNPSADYTSILVYVSEAFDGIVCKLSYNIGILDLERNIDISYCFKNSSQIEITNNIKWHDFEQALLF